MLTSFVNVILSDIQNLKFQVSGADESVASKEIRMNEEWRDELLASAEKNARTYYIVVFSV